MVDKAFNDASVEGFLLLSLPNCTVSTPSTAPQTGLLALQCVTMNTHSGDPIDRDVWLVLKLNSFEMVISPTQTVNYSRTTFTYMFLPEGPNNEPVRVDVPLDPSNPVSGQDLETFEVLLSQYGVLHDMDAISLSQKDEKDSQMLGEVVDVKPVAKQTADASDYKGRLVLMDEDSGEIMGALDESVPIREDSALKMKGHEKDPVVVELPTEEEELAGRIEAFVHPPTPEERDLLLKTAGLISRGIMFATSALAAGMTSASKYYISHSTPTSKPVEFSPRTKENVQRIHNISGKAVQVTTKTTGAIFKVVDSVATRVSGGSRSPSAPSTPTPPPRTTNSGNLSSNSMSPPPQKPRFINRLLASTDLLLSTIDHSAKKLIESGTEAISSSLSHKYGSEMGELSRITGNSAKNVALVYIDVRGVGRRALIKRAGKVVVKARMGRREVVLGPQTRTPFQTGSSGSPGSSSPPRYEAKPPPK